MSFLCERLGCSVQFGKQSSGLSVGSAPAFLPVLSFGIFYYETIPLCHAGGIVAGLVSDYTGGRATTCCAMLILAAPMVSSPISPSAS